MRWGRACPENSNGCEHRVSPAGDTDVEGVVRWPLCRLATSWDRCPVHQCSRTDRERNIPDLPRPADAGGQVVGGYRLSRLAGRSAPVFVTPVEPGNYWIIWNWARYFVERRVPFAVVLRGTCLVLIKELNTAIQG